MRSRRHAKITIPEAKVEMETSDEQTEIPMRQLRPRSKVKSSNRKLVVQQNTVQTENKEVQHSENAYDADYETDKTQGSNSGMETDDTNNGMQTDAESESLEKRQRGGKGTSECGQTSTYSYTCNEKPFVKIDKENITPPGSHSTPSLAQLRSLDRSLFGFNDLESPLPFSPVIGSISRRPSPSSTTSSMYSSFSTSTSEKKRKNDRSYDIPMENPKRPKRKRVKRERAQDQYLEELRGQFQEVEMHELVIEKG